MSVRRDGTLHRLTVRVSSLERSVGQYTALLGALGHGAPELDGAEASWGTLRIVEAIPVSRGHHVAFRAADRDAVDRAWRAGLDAGMSDDGAPGERDYGDGYYGGFLRDADGASVEAAHRPNAPAPSLIDHIWLGSADMETDRMRWMEVAVSLGLETMGLALPLLGLRSGDIPIVLAADGREAAQMIELAFLAPAAASPEMRQDPVHGGVQIELVSPRCDGV